MGNVYDRHRAVVSSCQTANMPVKFHEKTSSSWMVTSMNSRSIFDASVNVETCIAVKFLV